MSKRKCASCRSPLEHDEGYWAEGYKRDVCGECYYEIVKTCQLCGKDDVMPGNVSEFILCKAELTKTCRPGRPPGIFRILRRPFLSIPIIGSESMDGNDVLFVDKLPRFDRHYDISGHICQDCAKPYHKKFSAIYGSKPERYTRQGWNKQLWVTEREHTRSTILANPDMLRDLECDSVSVDRRTGKKIEGAWTGDWDEMRETYLLPGDLPAYHEWLLISYKGVKVYLTDREGIHGDGWLVLKPEPHYRRCAFGGSHSEPAGLFTASSLPTYKHKPDDGKYHSPYDGDREQSLPAIRKAIRLGLLKQEGTFDAKGKPILCR